MILPLTQYCILDILKHIPRSLFSDKQTSAICWAMSGLGVPSVPSQYILKRTLEDIQKVYGVKTIRCQGALGHIYYINDFCQIISQVDLEMSL